MKHIKTVSLIGLGAIGSYIASFLAPHLGDNLRIVAGGERGEKIKADGIVCNGRHFDLNVISPDDMSEPDDLVIVITKMYSLSDALRDIKNRVGPDTVVMTPLNGVDAEEEAEKVYPGQVIWSLMRASVVKEGNSSSFNAGISTIELGEKNGRSERVDAVEKLFADAGIRCVVQEDMLKAKWEKFVCNVSENQVSAILGLPFGAWGTYHANELRCMAADEVIAIARASGIMIDPDYARNHQKYLVTVPYFNKSSTLQDIEHGRRTEVETFAGAVIRRGEMCGVPTPINRFLYHAILALEDKNSGVIKSQDK